MAGIEPEKSAKKIAPEVGLGTLGLGTLIVALMTFRGATVGIPQTASGTGLLQWLRILTFLCFFSSIGLFVFAFATGSKTLANSSFPSVVALGVLHLLVPRGRKRDDL